jgi:hypothetical protein
MSPRQKLFLQIGCYLALATAAVHMIGQISGPQSENEAEKQVLDLMRTTKIALPGASRSMMEMFEGFGLIFVTFLATSAGIGLIVARRGAADPILAKAIMRALAGAFLVAMAISISKFFLIPTVCLGLIALFFVAASFGSRT